MFLAKNCKYFYTEGKDTSTRMIMLIQNKIKINMFLSIISSIILFNFSCYSESPVGLYWATSYETAISLSKKESKPIFLYFTGSDWCRWCRKMKSEILENPDFINLVGNSFIFYQVDFPIYYSPPPDQKKQNEELKAQFKVHGYPTIILIDENGKQFATLNYREGGGKLYGEYLLKVLKEHQDFQKGLHSLREQPMQNLENMYLYASRLGFVEDKHQILTAALGQNPSIFFLKEKYRYLLSIGKMNSDEAKNTKTMLIVLDSNNKKHTHYDLAVMEFETLAKNSPFESSANKIVLPLENYLKQFGAQDEKNRWKIEMMISQVFSSKDQTEEAVDYMKAAYSHAPIRERITIASTLAEMERNLEAIVHEE
jgi:protein disulfide-isomerase